MNIKTITINVGTTLILALLLESLLAFGLRNPGFIPDFMLTVYRKLYLEDRSIMQVTDCAEYDADLFYRFKEGDCIFANAEFEVLNEINSRGLRDDEASLSDPSVVIFGDSFTMGWGVRQENCYAQVLEKLTDRKVLNAGISSFGTAREMILLDKLGYGHINTVIIQYHPNDYEENLTSIKNNFILPIRPRESYDSLKRYIADRSRYFPFKYLKGVTKSVAVSMLREEPQRNDVLEAEAFLNILANSNIGRIAGHIVVFRVDGIRNDDNFADAVDRLLLDERFAKLKVTTVRVSGLMTKDDYFILDEHFNEAGHAKLAAKLRDYVGFNILPVNVVNLSPVE